MRRFFVTAIADSSALKDDSLMNRVEMLCSLGVHRIVLREYNSNKDEYLKIAKEFVEICEKYDVTPILTKKSYPEMNGFKLQLSFDEMIFNPEIMNLSVDVDVTVHSSEEAIKAESAGANSVTLAYVYPTMCGTGVPGGTKFLKETVSSVKIPVFALGGVDTDVVEKIYHTGAAGVCSMGMMMRSDSQHIRNFINTCYEINQPKFIPKDLKLYLVTDSSMLKEKESLCDAIEKSILGGVTMVQLREKNVSVNEYIEKAKHCLRVCRRYRIPFVVNDNVEVARAVGADGLHLGQNDVNITDAKKSFNGFIGISVHNYNELSSAISSGADYVGCGAVFPTSTKKDAESVPLNVLKELCSKSIVPVVAIGGINENNISSLKDTGIAGVAIVSAIFGKKDKYEASKIMNNHCNQFLTNE